MARPDPSVLILKPSSFGDVIHTLPAVACLKANWPGARLTWLVNSEWLPLIEGNPDLESIVEFPRREFRGWSGWMKFYRWQQRFVAGRRFDAVLDFQGLLRSAVIGRLGKPGIFYGMSGAREGARWFYDQTAPMPSGVPHAVERYLTLARFALRDQGIPDGENAVAPPLFALPPGEPLDAPAAAELSSDFVVLHPFARGRGKSLSMAQVEQFCTRLAPRQVVLVGQRPSDAGPASARSLDLLGRTSLRQLIWTLRRAAFVITVDSGPAHLAAALGCPMVAIHTWSDPRRVGPYRPDAWVWKSGRLAQTQNLPAWDPAIFTAPPPMLTAAHVAGICSLATLPSNSSA